MIRLTIIVFLLFYAIIYSQSPKVQLSEKDIDNLILCIESENEGIRSWGVFFAGKYQVEETVIPLLRVLHDDKNDAIRKLAVHALFRIGDTRGIFAIKGSARFDESEEVRNLCLSMVQLSEHISTLE
jgi:HEAT repeat protein